MRVTLAVCPHDPQDSPMNPLGSVVRSRWATPRLITAVFAVLLMVTGTLVGAGPGTAATASVPSSPSTSVDNAPAAAVPGVVRSSLTGFDPGTLIDDDLFYDGDAMSAAEIQAFLDARIGSCQNGRCLNVLETTVSSRAARYSTATGNLICGAIQGGNMRVSELIHRVQRACGISAKVILVTLQKEQGLVTSRAPSDWNLRAAMGQSCPDTAPCDPAFAGVGPQIVAGTTQLKTYRAANFARQPGTHFIQYNPNASCGGSNVRITNYATAALYNYTPYQPNAASLAAGYGLGDGCSSYGNRNFYNYYTDWFGAALRGGDPFGHIDVVEPQVGGFRVSGWAIDPDTTSPTQVHVYINGVGHVVTANRSRPDVANVYPDSGANHGFSMRLPAAPGAANVCIYAINTAGRGQNRLIGCRQGHTVSGSPEGRLDGVTAAEGGVRVRGWAVDPDTLDTLSVQVSVGGRQVRLLADVERADLRNHLLSHGTRRGYDAVIPAPPGEYTVCATGTNIGPGLDTELGCQTVTVADLPEQGRAPIGYLDSVTATGTALTVSGWSIDPDTAAPIDVHVYINGVGRAVRADRERADVSRLHPSYGSAHGYRLQAEGSIGSNRVCAYGVDSAGGTNRLLGCQTIEIAAPAAPVPSGSVDEVTVNGSSTTVTVRGWAAEPASAEALAVHVYVGTAGVALRANQLRPDVARVFPELGENRGYAAQIDVSGLARGSYPVCVYGINTQGGPNRLLAPCRVITLQ